MSEVLELTRALVARRSITPEDAGCQELLRARLEAAGFHGESLRFGAVDNLWIRHGTETPLLCFVGHTDVVPTGPPEQWSSDPFTPTERGGYLYGRGAADMKSGVAAMVLACERFARRAEQHRGSVALLLTSDEEGPAVDGTRRVVEWLRDRGERIEWCVVGEPTSHRELGDTVRVGRRGSLTGKLRIIGRQGHVAYPELVRNPIHLALPALGDLVARHWDDGDGCLPPTTLQFSNINSGTGAANVVPGALEAVLNFRFSTAQSVEDLDASVRRALDSHGLEYELEWLVPSAPYASTPGPLATAVDEAVHSVTGLECEHSTAGGTSDGRFVAAMGAEVVELGPINASIHRIDECVAVSDLEPLAKIYERVIDSLLGESIQ